MDDGNLVKTIFTSLILTAILIGPGCFNNKQVELRKFPYPYKSALAICSDIDQTPSIEEFITIQRFLNTDLETESGPGLNLDIGNSFWFYNDYLEHLRIPGSEYTGGIDSGLSLFCGLTDSLNDYALILLSLIKSGYIDCLHSYGHFGEERFTRHLAQRACEFQERESLSVDVYINHGAHGTNRQNLGDASWFLGDNPGSKYYHTDLSVRSGMKFIWRGQLTHCIGQDGDFSWINFLKNLYEWYQDFGYTGQEFPNDNKLVHIYRLDDSTDVFEFVRYVNPWGKYPEATEENIIHQLGPEQVDDLIENRGFMIFYTHFGRNGGEPYLSRSTIEALRFIEEKYEKNELLVTTTSKLLNYYIHTKYLYWHQEKSNDTIFISIDSIANSVEGNFIPSESDLAGLTFYVPRNQHIVLQLAGREIDYTANGGDETGRVSISIPWRRLSLPDDIYMLYKNF